MSQSPGMTYMPLASTTRAPRSGFAAFATPTIRFPRIVIVISRSSAPPETSTTVAGRKVVAGARAGWLDMRAASSTTMDRLTLSLHEGGLATEDTGMGSRRHEVGPPSHATEP